MGQEVDFMIHGYLEVPFFGRRFTLQPHMCVCLLCV